MIKDFSNQNNYKYSYKIWKRATRALSCSPFTLNLFIEMRNQSIPLPNIAGNQGVTCNYILKPISESKIESYLSWLINVGLLRREVDGQGLTDSFRLTPLGREIIGYWEAKSAIPPASRLDKILNWLNRWLGIFI